MDFRLTDDQVALRDGIRAFCSDRFDASHLAAVDAAGTFDRARWTELGELGVFSLTVLESAGGVGLGYPEAALVFEELGRVAAPGPLVWSMLAAGVVAGAADGSVIVGGVDVGSGATGAHLVEHLGTIDVLLVVSDAGVARIDAATITSDVAEPLDPLTPVRRVEHLPAGDPIGDAAEAQRLRNSGALLTAAFALGLAQGSLELARDYSLERQQFNRPIGAFQAVKHLLADCFARAELARPAVYAAAVMHDDPEAGDAERALAGAKLLAGRAAVANAATSLQVHGGMGFTWEVPVHYFLKRAWVLEQAFGDSAEHAERVAERVPAG